MNGSTRCGSPSFVVVILLGVILALLPVGTQVFAQSEDDQRAWLQALDSLSSERILADVRTLSSPAFNGRQAGSADDLRSAQWVAQELTVAGVQLPLIDNNGIAFASPMARKGEPVGIMASMVSTSLIEPDPVVRADGIFYALSGFEKISEALDQAEPLLACKLAAFENEPLGQYSNVDDFAQATWNSIEITHWETMHAFKFRSYPNWVEG